MNPKKIQKIQVIPNDTTVISRQNQNFRCQIAENYIVNPRNSKIQAIPK